jgi:type I restriction enzyme S subunit
MYDTAALKASFAGIDCSCNQAIAFAMLDEAIVAPIYVYFAIVIGREHFRRLQRGVRQKNLNLSMIRDIEIPKPNLSDQLRFARLVVEWEKIQVGQLVSLAKLDSFFDSIQRRAFKGELFEMSMASVGFDPENAWQQTLQS